MDHPDLKTYFCKQNHSLVKGGVENSIDLITKIFSGKQILS